MYVDESLNASSPNAPQCGIENFKGFCIDLARLIEPLVKQKFNICLVPDNAYGQRLDNGSWNGMLGQVVRQVDLLSPCRFSLFIFDLFAHS